MRGASSANVLIPVSPRRGSRGGAPITYTEDRIFMDQPNPALTPPVGTMQASVPGRMLDFFLSIWDAPNERVVQRGIFFLGCLLTICGIRALSGAVPTREYGHDIFILLDNGWRIINGQRPHLDYTSAWGPVTFLIAALGMKLSHYTVDGIGYVSAIFGFVIGLWSYAVSRDRMESSPRILLSYSWLHW
jgi:hypothetical protein